MSIKGKQRINKCDRIQIVFKEDQLFFPSYFQGNLHKIIEEGQIDESHFLFKQIVQQSSQKHDQAQIISQWDHTPSFGNSSNVQQNLSFVEENLNEGNANQPAKQFPKSMKIIHEINRIPDQSSFSSQKIIRQSTILGRLTQFSEILSQQDFSQLVSKMPILYKLYSWKVVYDSRRDGRAWSKFLSKVKEIQPAILLIQQQNGNTLGSFLVDALEPGKTGRGQMFIFSFNCLTRKIQAYPWTAVNNFFVFIDTSKGIGIGMGKEYGIFLDKTLSKGSSAPCDTFGNKASLSFQKDFNVRGVQVLGRDYGF